MIINLTKKILFLFLLHPLYLYAADASDQPCEAYNAIELFGSVEEARHADIAYLQGYMVDDVADHQPQDVNHKATLALLDAILASAPAEPSQDNTLDVESERAFKRICVNASTQTPKPCGLLIRDGLQPHCCNEIPTDRKKFMPWLAEHRFFFHTLKSKDKTCRFCCRCFASNESLQKHLKEVHQQSLCRLYACPFANKYACPAEFLTLYERHYHKEQHELYETVLQKHPELRCALLADNAVAVIEQQDGSPVERE